MPHYEIHHSCMLDASQKANIATAITLLHCRLFSAPSIFVNVTFHRALWSGQDCAGGDTQAIFVGGQLRQTNYIIGHIRPRGPDNREKLNTLVQEIAKIWNKQAQPKLKDPSANVREKTKHKKEKNNATRIEQMDAAALGRLDDKRALHNCFIMEDIVAGAEQGFMLPVAGQDGKWVEENMSAFEKRAAEGDESMQALLEEIKAGLGTGPVVKSKL